MSEGDGAFVGYLKPQYKHRWYSLRKGARHRRPKLVMCAALSLVMIAVLVAIVFVLLFVPSAIQKAFAGYGAEATGYPPTYFKEFYSNGMLLHMTNEFQFTNVIWTEIRLDQPFTFRDLGPERQSEYFENGKEGRLVATMPFDPVIGFGPSQRFVLNNELQVHLNNISHWTQLWKQWIGHSNYKKRLRENKLNSTANVEPWAVQQDTWWLIESKVSIRMGPFYWNNVPIAKRMIWNGGLDYAGKYVETKVLDTSVKNITSIPRIRLDMQYQSFSVVGFNFSTFAFSAYYIHRENDTYSKAVRLMDSQWNDFNYTKGVHNLTAENYVNFGTVPNTRSSLFQMGKNFVMNDTTLLVLKNFRTYGRQNLTQYELVSTAENYANGSIWVNEVLKSVSFVVELRRDLSLGKAALKLFKKSNESLVETSIKQVTQWSYSNKTMKADSGFDVAPTGTFVGLDEIRDGQLSPPDERALIELYSKQN